MANINRGEYEITVEGHPYTLVLTLNDLATLETSLQFGSEELWARLRDRKAWVGQVNAVLTRAFAHGTPQPLAKEVPLLLDQIPYTERRQAAMLLVAGALNYLNEQQPAEEDPPPDQPAAEEEIARDPLSATGN